MRGFSCVSRGFGYVFTLVRILDFVVFLIFFLISFLSFLDVKVFFIFLISIFI